MNPGDWTECKRTPGECRGPCSAANKPRATVDLFDNWLFRQDLRRIGITPALIVDPVETVADSKIFPLDNCNLYRFLHRPWVFLSIIQSKEELRASDHQCPSGFFFPSLPNGGVQRSTGVYDRTLAILILLA